MRNYIFSLKSVALVLSAAVLALSFAFTPRSNPKAPAYASGDGRAIAAVNKPEYYEAPKFAPDQNAALATGTYVEISPKYRISAYYPITESPSLNKAIGSLVMNRASSFRKSYGAGSLDILYTIYGYKDTIFSCVLDIYEYSADKGLARSYASINYDLLLDKPITSADMFAANAYNAAEFQAFALDDGAALFFCAGGEIKTEPLSDFSDDFSGERYMRKNHPEIGPPAPADEPPEDNPTEDLQDPLAPPGKLIAISYDDGPHRVFTPIILDALKKYNAKATFYVVGNRVDVLADLVKREADEGHEVGNHTYDHKQLTTLSKAAIIKEIESTSKAIEAVIGAAPTTLRPPYGSFNAAVLSIAGERGMAVVNWDVDTNDWRGKSGRAIADWVISHAHEGAIVLMHDFYPGTADAAPLILDELTKQGYTFVTVDELIKSHEERIVAGAMYYNWSAKK